MEHNMETTIVYRGFIGIIANRLEITLVYRGYLHLGPNREKLDDLGLPPQALNRKP